MKYNLPGLASTTTVLTNFGLVATCCLALAGCSQTAEKESEIVAAGTLNDAEATAELQFPPDQTSDVGKPRTESRRSRALDAFLEKFDRLSAMGFVPTLRAGSTGIGYTLETMMDIEENNSPKGDFLGMELKAFRDDDLHMDDSEKMNLFLKEPEWTDGLSGNERVQQYGCVDDNGRTALYSTVTINKSSHGFAFRVDHANSRVWMQINDRDIAFWTFEILEQRLIEKHNEAVFVAAHSQGSGKDEQFHYYAVTWCSKPLVESFVRLIESGDVMLELRLHLNETGGVRNHGSAFRIKQNRIPNLYRVSRQVRPVTGNHN